MKLLKSSNTLTLSNAESLQEKLEKGVYILKYNERVGEYYLTKTENFKLPTKIYGKHEIVKRWLKSWQESSKNLGILLSGLKGSGKTIAAQMLCLESDSPVILINDIIVNITDFSDFITSPVFNNSILFFDEFEKVFSNYQQQEELLSLIDGPFATKLLWLFTVNENKLSSYFYNRLGRIKYRKAYNRLEDDVILDIIDDLLINKDHKEELLSVINSLDVVSMDILINIIKDMNLFNESVKEVIPHLNLKSEPSYYTVTEIFKDKKVELSNLTSFDFLKFKHNNQSQVLYRSDQKFQYELDELNPEKFSVEEKLVYDIAQSDGVAVNNNKFEIIEKTAGHIILAYKHCPSYKLYFKRLDPSGNSDFLF